MSVNIFFYSFCFSGGTAGQDVLNNDSAGVAQGGGNTRRSQRCLVPDFTREGGGAMRAALPRDLHVTGGVGVYEESSLSPRRALPASPGPEDTNAQWAQRSHVQRGPSEDVRRAGRWAGC